MEPEEKRKKWTQADYDAAVIDMISLYDEDQVDKLRNVTVFEWVFDWPLAHELPRPDKTELHAAITRYFGRLFAAHSMPLGILEKVVRVTYHRAGGWHGGFLVGPEINCRRE